MIRWSDLLSSGRRGTDKCIYQVQLLRNIYLDLIMVTIGVGGLISNEVIEINSPRFSFSVNFRLISQPCCLAFILKIHGYNSTCSTPAFACHGRTFTLYLQMALNSQRHAVKTGSSWRCGTAVCGDKSHQSPDGCE